MPYIFKTTTTLPSKNFPGVMLVVRKMTEERRIELQEAVREPTRKIRDMLVKADTLERENEAVNRAEILSLRDEMNTVVTRDLNVAKIRWGVAAIQNLCLGDEGTIATLDNVLKWPSKLIEECLDIVEKGTGMTEEEVKNSGSPSISGAGTEERREDSTTAPSVGGTAAS